MYREPPQYNLFGCTTVKKSTDSAWAYTIKCLKPTVTRSEYENIVQRWRDNCIVEYEVYELDPKGYLHVHGIVRIPKGYYRKKLNTREFHTYLTEVTNREGWERYIMKDQAYNMCPRSPSSLSESPIDDI